MTSDLLVALLSGRVIEHIHGFDDGVSAEFAFDAEQRPLHLQFGLPDRSASDRGPPSGATFLDGSSKVSNKSGWTYPEPSDR